MGHVKAGTDSSEPVPANREGHILRYALDGHSRQYITERLFISENTVEEQLEKIFAKTGVHSKNSLEHVLPMC